MSDIPEARAALHRHAAMLWLSNAEKARIVGAPEMCADFYALAREQLWEALRAHADASDLQGARDVLAMLDGVGPQKDDT